jgi:hypothetical protein
VATGCGSVRASVRRPARSSPPGRPRTSSSSARSRPVSPTWASAGTPSARSSAQRSGGIAPSAPAIDPASSGLVGRAALAAGDRLAGQQGAVGGADRGALGQPGAAAEALALAQPGEREAAPPGDAGLVAVLDDRQRDRLPDGAEDPGACHDRHADGPTRRLGHGAGAEAR